MEQAKTFYANILADTNLMDLISVYGYTPEKLQQESALIVRVAAQHLAQKTAIGEAQSATPENR